MYQITKEFYILLSYLFTSKNGYKLRYITFQYLNIIAHKGEGGCGLI